MTRPVTSITGATRLFLLLGRPVGHSLSPALHNAAFTRSGIDAAYLALTCESDAVPALVRTVAEAGGGGNITVPHKMAAADVVDQPTPAVHATGACNTFWRDDAGTLCGDNTDVAGFVRAAEDLLGSPLSGRSVLILGAGGAARAVIHGLREEGASHMAIRNRTPERAERLIRDMGVEAELIDPLYDRLEAYDLIVNATSLGLRTDDPFPVPPSSVPPAAAALDLVYRPGASGTPWVRALRDAGRRAADGRGMLLEQAVAAFGRWFPGVEARTAMQRALDSG